MLNITLWYRFPGFICDQNYIFLPAGLPSRAFFRMDAARSHPGRSTNRPRRVTVQSVDSPAGLRADAFLIKGSDRRGLEQTEETMKLISNYELQKRSDSELAALFRAV